MCLMRCLIAERLANLIGMGKETGLNMQNEGVLIPLKDYELAREALMETISALEKAARAAVNLTDKLKTDSKISVADQWVNVWGEAISKSAAAVMLGVSRSTIYAYVANGAIETSPEGKVLVRSAAQWANGSQKMRKHRRRQK